MEKKKNGIKWNGLTYIKGVLSWETRHGGLFHRIIFSRLTCDQVNDIFFAIVISTCYSSWQGVRLPLFTSASHPSETLLNVPSGWSSAGRKIETEPVGQGEHASQPPCRKRTKCKQKLFYLQKSFSSPISKDSGWQHCQKYLIKDRNDVEASGLQTTNPFSSRKLINEELPLPRESS